MATAKRLLNKENDATARRIRRLLQGTLAKQYVASIRTEWETISKEVIAEMVPVDSGTLAKSFVVDGISKAKNKFSYTTGFEGVSYGPYQEGKEPPPSAKSGLDWYQNHPDSHVFNGLSKPNAGPHFLATMMETFEDSLREIASELKKTVVVTAKKELKKGKKKK